MTRNDKYSKKDEIELKDTQKISPEVLQEMIDEAKNIDTTPWTIFLKDIGMINVLDMTGTINRTTGEHKLLVLDDAGGMWQIKEEFVIAIRNNVMKSEDYTHFNEMKAQSEENTKRWEESEKKLGLDNSFL